ncbi:MAG: tail fiber protein [Bacteroidia bacterium]|jgi:microcystin-dependent protein|nr:tail fiber protein [Bacteroidia bacterium]
MEGYISEIRLFAPNFVPRNWLSCSGQIMSISQNTAMFSLLGTTFGGNGINTFGIPDLRGRTALGSGVSPVSNSNYVLGQMSGSEMVTLTTAQMPGHNHQTSVAGPTLKVSVNNANGDTAIPTNGSSIAAANVPGRTPTPASGFNAATPDIALNSGSLIFGPTAYGISGGSVPHNNLQPYLGLNYIICQYGIYPSRN